MTVCQFAGRLIQSAVMSTRLFRWGILGTAQIARKNWKAIRNSDNGIITAVASRDVERSRRFIDECQAEAPFPQRPRALGSYEELLNATDIDGVYIPLPTGIRQEWVIRAAEARKHVVSEKPCAGSVAELERMVEACRHHGVQFIDGVMFMHSRRLNRILDAIESDRAIGRIRRIQSAFTFSAPDEFLTGNIRTHSGLEPLGCLGDLGWYCIRFTLWAMHWQMPLHVTGRILSKHTRKDSPHEVPIEFSGELQFADNISAGFYCSFITGNQQWAHISGTEGYLYVPDFVLPFFGSELSFDVQNAVFNVQGCDFNMESHLRRYAVHEYSNSHATSQETNLFRTFADQAQSGSLNTEWPEFALKTQQVANAALESALANGATIRL